MKQIKYLMRLSIDCEYTDEELREMGFELFRDSWGERCVIYKPLDRKTLYPGDIKIWEFVESIEAFDELEQITGQLEFLGEMK